MLLLLYVLVDVEVAREEDAIEDAKVCWVVVVGVVVCESTSEDWIEEVKLALSTDERLHVSIVAVIDWLAIESMPV